MPSLVGRRLSARCAPSGLTPNPPPSRVPLLNQERSWRELRELWSGKTHPDKLGAARRAFDRPGTTSAITKAPARRGRGIRPALRTIPELRAARIALPLGNVG